MEESTFNIKVFTKYTKISNICKSQSNIKKTKLSEIKDINASEKGKKFKDMSIEEKKQYRREKYMLRKLSMSEDEKKTNKK